MADVSDTVTVEAYARSRGVARRAIQQQVEKGVIEVIDGRISPAQADASWGAIRRASTLGKHQRNEVGERSAKAKIALTLAKLRSIKARLDVTRERYLDRAEAVAVGASEATYVLDAWKASPAAYAATLATEMGIPPAKAQAILERFVHLTLGEIGDLAGQAVRDAQRA